MFPMLQEKMEVSEFDFINQLECILRLYNWFMEIKNHKNQATESFTTTDHEPQGCLIGKKLKHEKLEETKHGLFRNCFLGAPEQEASTKRVSDIIP